MKASTIEATIKEINQEANELRGRLDRIEGIRKALQKDCPHEWKENGHDSHYDYERCIICGLERKV